MRKRKLSRRRYKVRKKILEIRLKTLSRNLTASRQKLQNFGSSFVDLMRQLEVSETEISEIETNIESIETRHRRGELSLEAYRKLLVAFEKRKEEAETAINGILIRLREKIN
jgi:septal ring factor EnvC (AmiA/AmiB activator)